MASKERLPSGRYRGIYYDANGDKQRVPGTFRLASEALNAAKDAEAIARRQASLAAGTLPATITWNEWWDIIRVNREFESDTPDQERRLVKNHLTPQWGDTPLNKIDRDAVQNWVNSLCARRTKAGTLYSAAYIRRIYSLFSVTIRAAIKHRPPVLLVSPLVEIELPVVRRKKKAFVAMENAPKLKKHLRDDYADVVAFALETGLRPGELAGLHDDQIDEAGRLLWVTTVYILRARRMRGHPKDEDARTVPLSAAALTIYRRRTAGRDMRRPCGVQHYHGQCTNDVVFRTGAGSVLDANKLLEVMKRACAKAGIPAASGYALRRGFATRLARGGIDLFELMDIMGWEDPELAREYVQQSPGARDRLMAALGDPSATGLRVVQAADVGLDHGHGIDRGMPADETPRKQAHSKRPRKTS
jgi:integrase